MRWVVLVFVSATFILWDVVRNDTRYLNKSFRFIEDGITRLL